ncbi:MAG: DNA repair protein RadC [Lentisphaeria bacterium]|nr:DNA repair protein RadC [Lentisphaeria bacterium]
MKVNSSLIADLPNPERPRERMQRLGAAALSDRELLAILLRTGTRGKSALSLAADLLQRYEGSLSRLADSSIHELGKTPGIGKVKATELCAAFALSARISQQECRNLPMMNNPAKVASYVRQSLNQREQEEFHVLLLDSRMRLMRSELITVGLLDRSLVHPREVFRVAIKEACQSLILCHNHPSGDISPSQEDKHSTKMLQKAGKIVGISILDHVIISSRREDLEYFSFREASLMLSDKELE